jgi:hypothetical protein
VAVVRVVICFRVVVLVLFVSFNFVVVFFIVVIVVFVIEILSAVGVAGAHAVQLRLVAPSEVVVVLVRGEGTISALGKRGRVRDVHGHRHGYGMQVGVYVRRGHC